MYHQEHFIFCLSQKFILKNDFLFGMYHHILCFSSPFFLSISFVDLTVVFSFCFRNFQLVAQKLKEADITEQDSLLLVSYDPILFYFG